MGDRDYVYLRVPASDDGVALMTCDLQTGRLNLDGADITEAVERLIYIADRCAKNPSPGNVEAVADAIDKVRGVSGE